MLHSLVNLLEIDIERFLHIKFEKIEVTTYEGNSILLRQSVDKSDNLIVELHLDGQRLGICSQQEPYPPDIINPLTNLFTKKPVYLPAYRTILEGTSRGSRFLPRSNSEFSETEQKNLNARETEFLKQRKGVTMHPYYIEQKADSTAYKTLMCRSWFGKFVPVVRYPSISEVHRELEEEVERARFIVAAQDEKNISAVFKNVLEVVLSKKQTRIDEDIDSLVNRVRSAVQNLEPGDRSAPAVYSDIAQVLKQSQYTVTDSSNDIIKGILKVYDDALSTRTVHKDKAYLGIDTFISSVNRFLENKPLNYSYNKITNRARGRSFVTLPNGEQVDFNVFSSGERHIVTLLFAATHMSPSEGIVVIDEPELSLHIDWQRIILGEICKQANHRQVIACTHSPEVAAEHMDAYIDLINLPILKKTDIDCAEQRDIGLED